MEGTELQSPNSKIRSSVSFVTGDHDGDTALVPVAGYLRRYQFAAIPAPATEVCHGASRSNSHCWQHRYAALPCCKSGRICPVDAG